MRSFGIVLWAVTMGALVLVTSTASAQDDPALVEQGRRIFEARGCYGCHTIGDVGAKSAPSLTRVGAKYSRAYLTSWLRDTPPRAWKEHMPKIQATEPEIQALAAYLSSLREF
ncbi:MAG TPA: cytochrome c [Candidatus Nitrosotalea sp.]|nr:cytochrome c [Candidatus Nitrosotalea sp.]